jgi:hypothetical protein
MSGARHLVGVWNPSYADDVMDAHLAVLLGRIRELRALPEGDPRHDAGEADVHVWWGKVRSANRQQPLGHLSEILALDAITSDDAREVQLYLTDYRSLYIAHVIEITADDVRLDEGSHVPRYYTERNLSCDCWFRLGDIRRIVADDTLGVIAELRKLSNTHYNDRPVSLYGGMVNLPLIVTRSDDATFFEPEARDALTDGRYWAEFDAERTGLGAIERELRDNLFGESAWSALDPAVRGFIAGAEHLFRAQRRTPAFDFSGVVLDLAKACEVQGNRMLHRALRRAKPGDRMVNLGGRSVDLLGVPSLSAGELARVLEEPTLRPVLTRQLRDAVWFTGQFPSVLREIARFRNPAAHSEPVGPDDAVRLRDHMVGVGCHGHLVQLARVQPL